MRTLGWAALLGALTFAPAAQAIEGYLELRPAQTDAEVAPPLPPPEVFPVQLVIDDDSQEAAFGVSGAGGAQQFLWFNQLTRPVGVEDFTLEEIWVLFPAGAGIMAGDAVQLAIYLDPDGDPTNGADFLATFDEVIQVVDDVTFSVYPIAPVGITGPGDVLIGVIPRFIDSGVTPPTAPASLDLTASQQRSWFAVWNGDPPDPPADLTAASLVTRIGDFTPPADGNWLIRGFGRGPEPVIAAVPTLGEWGLVAFGLLLLAAAGWSLRRRRAGGVLLGLVLSLALSLPARAQIEIDTFNTAQAELLLEDPPDSVGDRASAAGGPGSMIGAFRGLEITWREGGSGPVSTEVAGGSLLLDVAADSAAETIVTWDGDNDPDTLTTGPGFAGGPAINLITAGGGPASSFSLTVQSAAAGTQVEVVVYSSADDFSTTGKVLPAIAAPTEVFFDYSSFLADPGGAGADFTDVVAIQLILRASGIESGGAVSFSADHFNTIVALITAIKADALTVDTDMDGQADPGDRLTYTVTITNTGGEALSVDLDDLVDGNTTLVTGSVSATPVAKDDQYRAVGNVTLNADGSAGRAGLLLNDRDPDGNPGECTGCTVTALRDSSGTPNTSERGGTLSLANAAQGFFAYTPPAGARGVDSFVYEIDDGEGNTTTGTAVIDIQGIVWFVDNTHGGPFEGTQANPFATTKAAEMASDIGDIIRVRAGDGTDNGHNLGHVLKDDQTLVGGAADLVVGGELIEAGSTHSVHSHAAGHVLELASNNTVLGVSLNSSAGTFHALAGVGSSNAALDNVIINPGGIGGGIFLSGHTGGFTFANSAITTANATLGTGVEISAGSGAFDFSGSPIAINGGGLITINGLGAGDIVNFTGSTPTLVDGTDDGIVLSGNPGATFLFDAIGNIITEGPAVPMLGGGGGPLTTELEGIFVSNSGTVGVNSIGAVDVINGLGVSVSGTTVAKNGVAGPLTLASLAASGGSVGLNLDGVGPDVTISGATTIIGSATGITLLNLDDITFGGVLTVGASAGHGLQAAATNTVTATNAANSMSASGRALDLNGTVMALSFANLSASGGTSAGVDLVNTTGSLSAAAGTITGGLSATAFNVDGGAPTVTYSGSVTQNSAQRVVNVEDTSGGSVSFSSGAVTGGASSLGVRIANADGNTTFADLDLGTSGAPLTNQALTLIGGSTGTHSFASAQIFTNGANGVHADNGGTVQFTGSGNRVSATNGRAITFENGTTIGAAGATFERVDASGSDRGIRLASAGSGFAVAGDGPNGTDGSGGTLQNITARGVEVISTDDVTLQNMNLTDAATTNGADPTDANGTCGGLALGQNLGCNAPVHLQTVSGAVLDNVHVLRSVQVGINGNDVTDFALRNSSVTDAGNQANEFSLKFRDLLGTSEITNSTVRRTVSSGTEVDQVRIQNFSSTALDLTVTNSHFDTNAADGPTSAFENTGFIAVGHSSAQMRLEFVGSFFENNKGPGLTAGISDGTSNADVDIVVTGGTFRNNNVGLEAIGHGTASTVTFDINGATVDDNPAAGINIDLNSSSAAGVTLQGHVRNNNVTHSGAGDCVQVNTRGAGRAVVAITGNTLNESGFERAIDVSTQEGSGDLDVVITGNTLNMTGPNPVRAMNVNSGADTGDSGTMCAKVGGSTVAERNTVNSISSGDTRVRVRRRENTLVNLQGVPGPLPQTNQATIEAYITSQNTGAVGNATVGGGFGDATCVVAPMP